MRLLQRAYVNWKTTREVQQSLNRLSYTDEKKVEKELLIFFAPKKNEGPITHFNERVRFFQEKADKTKFDHEFLRILLKIQSGLNRLHNDDQLDFIVKQFQSLTRNLAKNLKKIKIKLNAESQRFVAEYKIASKKLSSSIELISCSENYDGYKKFKLAEINWKKTKEKYSHLKEILENTDPTLASPIEEVSKLSLQMEDRIGKIKETYFTIYSCRLLTLILDNNQGSVAKEKILQFVRKQRSTCAYFIDHFINNRGDFNVDLFIKKLAKVGYKDDFNHQQIEILKNFMQIVLGQSNKFFHIALQKVHFSFQKSALELETALAEGKKNNDSIAIKKEVIENYNKIKNAYKIHLSQVPFQLFSLQKLQFEKRVRRLNSLLEAHTLNNCLYRVKEGIANFNAATKKLEEALNDAKRPIQDTKRILIVAKEILTDYRRAEKELSAIFSSKDYPFTKEHCAYYRDVFLEVREKYAPPDDSNFLMVKSWLNSPAGQIYLHEKINGLNAANDPAKSDFIFFSQDELDKRIESIQKEGLYSPERYKKFVEKIQLESYRNRAIPKLTKMLEQEEDSIKIIRLNRLIQLRESECKDIERDIMIAV